MRFVLLSPLILTVFVAAAIIGGRHQPCHGTIAFKNLNLHGYMLLDPRLSIATRVPHHDNLVRNPQWSPDNTHIAFTKAIPLEAGGGFGLYMMDRYGNGLELLAVGRETMPNLAWSPDGEWIAFESELSVHVLNIEDRSIIRLPAGDLRPYLGGWSPMSDAIVIEEYERSFGANLTLANVASQILEPITDSQQGSYDYFAAWTPDGNILFHSNRRSSEDQLTLHLVDMQTGEISQHLNQFVNHLTWTSDQSGFVYMASEPTGHPNISLQNIFHMDWGTGKVAQLTEDGTIVHESFFQPVLSPDDRYIAFESFDGNDYELHVMDIDGGNRRQLTNNSYSDTRPQWIPCPSP